MTPLESRRSQAGRAAAAFAVILVLIVATLAGGAFYFRARLESQPPQIVLSPNTDVAGLAPLEIEVTDPGAGLKSVTATLTQGGGGQTLASEEFATPIPGKKITVALAKVTGIKEGPAVLHVVARDASLWHWGSGNKTVFEKNITVDVTPPSLHLVADDRYINFGGVGAIVYKASADTATTGVKVGGHFFPGFKGVVQGHPDDYFALFSHAYDVQPTDRATVVATDKAGNTKEMRLAYELKNVKYKKSTIAISDSFFQDKVVALRHDVAKREGAGEVVFTSGGKGVCM